MREERRRLQRGGATFQELTAARNPAAAAGGNIYYRTYLTQDGAMAVGALSPTLWAKVRTAIGTEFLGFGDPSLNFGDPDFAVKLREGVAGVEALVRAKTTDEWLAIFEREGVPAGKVQFPEDMFEDPQVLANEMMVELEHDLSGPQTMVAPILRMSKSPPMAQGASPPLGRDTEHYLKLAGLSDAEIADMRARGVIQ